MRSKVLVATFATLQTGLALAAITDKPACKTITQATWKVNSDKCYGGIKAAVAAKQLTEEKAQAICSCVADELAYKQSCDEIKKFDGDIGYQKQKMHVIGAMCSSAEAKK